MHMSVLRTAASLAWVAVGGLNSAVVQAADARPQPLAVSDPASADNLLRVFGGLLVVVVLIVALVWGLKRLQQFPTRGSTALRVIGALGVGQRERVVLVQVGDEQLVLGVTANRIDRLHVLEHPLDVSSAGDETTSGFATKLRDVLQSGQGR